jgi:hypothetical protein
MQAVKAIRWRRRVIAVALVALFFSIAVSADAATKFHYRCTKEKSVHFDRLDTAVKYKKTLLQLEVVADIYPDADGQFDVHYICPEWLTAEVNDQESADTLLKFLEQLDFEISRD